MKTGVLSTKFSPATAIFLVGSLGSGLIYHLLSGDWACGVLGVGLAGGIIATTLWVAEKAFRRARHERPNGSSWNYRHQITLLLLFVVSIIGWARLAKVVIKHNDFKAALGLPLPSAISDLTVERHGLMDMVCLMKFHANRNVIEQIVSQRPMHKEEDEIAEYRQGDLDWSKLWYDAGGNMAAPFNTSWESMPPMKPPELYEWSNYSGASPGALENPLQKVHLLWDAVTEQAYVIYTTG